MEKYLLVTTDDERTWGSNQPILFLGEWCKRYSKKPVWQDRLYDTVECWYKSRTELDNNYKIARELERKIFPLLVRALNKFHNLDNSEKYWMIVLGSWFRRYVELVFSRSKMLNYCFENYDVGSVKSFYFPGYIFAQKNSSSAYWATNDNMWNNIFYYELIKFFDFKVDVELLETVERDIYPSVFQKGKSNKIAEVAKKALQTFLAEIYFKMTRDHDAFLIGTRLSRTDFLKLSVRLRQFPVFLKDYNQKYEAQFDFSKRQRFQSFFDEIPSRDKFFNAIVSFVSKLIPICYLEGYGEIKSLSKSLKLPRYPKFVFTSNSYDTDEVFKIWTAEKSLLGVNLIIGQHGNNFGTHRYRNPSIAELMSDKFLTWGWVCNSEKYLKGFLFTASVFKNRNWIRGNNLVYVQGMANHRHEVYDQYSKVDSQFAFHFHFFSLLELYIQSTSIIRLYVHHYRFSFDEEKRWKDAFPSVKVDDGSTAIGGLLNKTKLVVFGYDSTGFLEALNNDFPAICLWPSGYDHLKDDVIPLYQGLVDNGLVHFSSESAAKVVNEAWPDLAAWWYNSDRQDAILEFCNVFAARSSNGPDDLAEILLKSVKLVK